MPAMMRQCLLCVPCIWLACTNQVAAARGLIWHAMFTTLQELAIDSSRPSYTTAGATGDIDPLTCRTFPAGVAVPCDKQAIGWRVAVYWPEDSTLHDGEIVGYDNLSLRHHVRYDCGDQEHLTLDATKVSCAYCDRSMLGRRREYIAT